MRHRPKQGYSAKRCWLAHLQDSLPALNHGVERPINWKTNQHRKQRYHSWTTLLQSSPYFPSPFHTAQWPLCVNCFCWFSLLSSMYIGRAGPQIPNERVGTRVELNQTCIDCTEEHDGNHFLFYQWKNKFRLVVIIIHVALTALLIPEGSRTNLTLVHLGKLTQKTATNKVLLGQ